MKSGFVISRLRRFCLFIGMYILYCGWLNKVQLKLRTLQWMALYRYQSSNKIFVFLRFCKISYFSCWILHFLCQHNNRKLNLKFTFSIRFPTLNASLYVRDKAKKGGDITSMAFILFSTKFEIRPDHWEDKQEHWCKFMDSVSSI